MLLRMHSPNVTHKNADFLLSIYAQLYSLSLFAGCVFASVWPTIIRWTGDTPVLYVNNLLSAAP
ncbi:uncharacterized protein PHACADRAFT_254380 [Phanerochaete carnosa HHB-10118-sp]|uniref:Uncharacterized protein n=1 Tax=Phanerochaete carnosa (strain HHB-10118-sp) TaxID=650164 RepID=K5X2E3_PHACS|nr:uncharacterized protein PHACADRAFT_254380 [Phanerochaete carnosa HHB-10118-sp]EKM56962.1 hypothetical protein PHACADRAFT_254380 [Phanerochaete carnosa HHB-10118-sp]